MIQPDPSTQVINLFQRRCVIGKVAVHPHYVVAQAEKNWIEREMQQNRMLPEERQALVEMNREKPGFWRALWGEITGSWVKPF